MTYCQPRVVLPAADDRYNQQDAGHVIDEVAFTIHEERG